MIPEPQRTYILELLKALGPGADDFVVAGAQAMKFFLERTRATKDIDFVLVVVGLRGEELSIGAKLQDLGYTAVESSRNFQFEKPIPNSAETMRIEFMAPEEFKRERDFRVDVDKGVHARACTGGSIAIAESALHAISGRLPDGSPFETSIRVTKPHALVMLKLLALDDRYRNIRGLAEARHDREEARTHAADIVAIVSVQVDADKFKTDFRGQTPVLQYHFNWKTLSAMAGVTWWNFYFRLFPGAIRSPQIIEFLSHLLRHIPGKLLIVWDGLPGHRSRMVWDFVRQQHGRLWLEFLPADAPERTRSSTCGRTGSTMNCRTSVPTATENLVTTLAKHYGGCAAGPCWSARFGSRQSCFLCNYIM